MKHLEVSGAVRHIYICVCVCVCVCVYVIRWLKVNSPFNRTYTYMHYYFTFSNSNPRSKSHMFFILFSERSLFPKHHHPIYLSNGKGNFFL